MYTSQSSEPIHELITAHKAHELAQETNEQEFQELFPLSLPTSIESKKSHEERLKLFEYKIALEEEHNRKIKAAKASLASCKLGCDILILGMGIWWLNGHSSNSHSPSTTPSYLGTMLDLFGPSCVLIGSGLFARGAYFAYSGGFYRQANISKKPE